MNLQKTWSANDANTPKGKTFVLKFKYILVTSLC